MILHTLIDYDVLRLIWWALLGTLLVGFAVTDGFDLGTAILLPFVGRNDIERNITLDSVGPIWEGNQVWLVLGGGAIFAAWPPLYAASFSGFYLAMFAVLFALILRPLGFKYRNMRESARWRSTWDWLLFVAGVVPALIFGVAMGNVLLGVPFRFDADLRFYYEGSFFGLLTPFALLSGLVSVAMLTMHGATWVGFKTAGPVAERAREYGSYAALATVLLFALAGGALWGFVDGYRITGVIDHLGPSNPLRKTAEIASGAWFANYEAHPLLLLVPALGLIGAALACVFLRIRASTAALLSSAISVAAIIVTVGVSTFPFLLPSSLNPSASLTVWDASSSHLTLFIMLVATLIFMPLILAYTSWVYSVLRGKVDEHTVSDPDSHAY